MKDNNELLDFHDICKLLGISEGSGRNYIKKNRIPPPFKLPGGRKLYWRKEDIDQFLAEAAQNATKNAQ